jgi:hypothetical protein
MMGQNIENAKLVLQVISGLPKLDVEEAPRTNGLIEQDRSGWPPAAIDHRRREPSASPSTGTPVRPFRSRSSDRRRRSSRSKTRRSGSPRRRRLSRSPSGRSRRGEFEDCGDRRPRRADSSRSRSRQHRPEAKPRGASQNDLRDIYLVREHQRIKRENEELRAQLQGQLACFVSCTHSRVLLK